MAKNFLRPSRFGSSPPRELLMLHEVRRDELVDQVELPPADDLLVEAANHAGDVLSHLAPSLPFGRQTLRRP
jgi:hypothetical protein